MSLKAPGGPVNLSDSQGDDPPIFPCQRIKDNPSLHDLGQPSGAEIFREISYKGPPQDDLVDIFRWMLDYPQLSFEPTAEEEPVYWQDTPEGKKWAELAYNAWLEDQKQKLEQPIPNSDLDPVDSQAPLVSVIKSRNGVAAKESQHEEADLVTDIATKIKAEREEADKLNNLQASAADANQELETGPFDYECYISNCNFGTNIQRIYERHVVTKHCGKGICYPGLADLKLHGWKPQGRKWEI